MILLSIAISAASLFELAIAQVSGQATCYFPNGTATPDTPEYLQYQACPGSTICCGVNRTNPAGGDPANGSTIDGCLPNGLCQNRVTENGIGQASYWVDFCTNSNVSGGGCLDVCRETRNAFGISSIVPCDGTATSERWCCGILSDCCTSNFGVVRLPQVLGGTLSSIVSSATTLSSGASLNAASTGSFTSPASPTSASTGVGSDSSNTSSSDSGSKLSGGAIAGIVIGALAGVALLAAAIFFARRAAVWKKKASAASEAGTQHSSGLAMAGYEGPTSDKYAHAHQGELHGNAPAHELPGEGVGSELPVTAAKSS